MDIIFKSFDPGFCDPAGGLGVVALEGFLYRNVPPLGQLIELYAQIAGGGAGLSPEKCKVSLLHTDQQ